MSNFGVYNDEPAIVDDLQRGRYAAALGRMIQQCDTPLVVGLYGTWGVGKTSLMRQIQSELRESTSCRSVWFDAWEHQFDENPAVALLHTMVEDLDLGEEGRKLLRVVSSAIGSLILKSTTTVAAGDLRELADRYDEQRFLLREKQVRLRRHFARLLSKATDGGKTRLVFFIDDLDRCLPDHVLKTLEALKLFLNMPGCLYVLGVDRAALESSIRRSYQQGELSEADYLDKIVQLPFTIPPIADAPLEGFIRKLLPTELEHLGPILIGHLGGNPRQVKRFVNSLMLNHNLAQSLLGDAYRSDYLAAVLMIQYQDPAFFKRALQDPTRFIDIDQGGVIDSLRELSFLLVGATVESIQPYLFLSELATARRLTFDVELSSVGGNAAPVIAVLGELGLDEQRARGVIESAPTIVTTVNSRFDAQRIADRLLSPDRSRD